MTKNKNAIIWLLCMAVVFAMFFSIFFIAAEYNHDCTGEHCPICHEIQVCIQTLNTLGAVLAVSVVIYVAIHFFVLHFVAIFSRNCVHTLVLLKVKLSD